MTDVDTIPAEAPRAETLDAYDEQGGPAFPFVVDNGDTNEVYYGMSLRDWFAGQALKGLLGPGLRDHSDTVESVVYNAYLYADAMLKARDGKP